MKLEQLKLYKTPTSSEYTYRPIYRFTFIILINFDKIPSGRKSERSIGKESFENSRGTLSEKLLELYKTADGHGSL